MAEDDLFLAVVSSRIELILCEFLRIVYRPAAKGAGDRDNVILRIAAIDSEGVQFHYFLRP